MAEQIGVTKSAYSNWEIGKSELTYNNLIKISEVLKRNVIDIITYPDKYVISSSDSEMIDTYIQIKLKGKKKKEILDIVLRDPDFEIK